MYTTLETGRLLLRPVSRQDEALMHDLYTDPELMRYNGNNGKPFTPEQVKEAIQRNIERWNQYGLGNYTVIEKESGRAIGIVGMSRPEDSELGWMIRPECQGKGYAQEATLAVMKYLHNSWEMGKVGFVVHPINSVSHHLAKKFGGRRTGTADQGGEQWPRYEADLTQLFGPTPSGFTFVTAPAPARM